MEVPPDKPEIPFNFFGLPPDLQWLLQYIIENTFSLSSAMEILNQTESSPNSIWGKICSAIYGRNRPLLRKKCYLKWVRNVSSIQDYVNMHFESNSIQPKLNQYISANDSNCQEYSKTELVNPISIIQPDKEDFQIRYELERLTIQFRTAVVSKCILKDIVSSGICTLNMMSNLHQFILQIDLKCLELELKNDNLFTLWASGSCEIDSYLESVKDVKILLSDREIDHGDNRAYYNNCDSQIWFDGIKHYEMTNEADIHIHNGFILCKKDYTFDELLNFVNIFTEKYDSKLLERSQILLLWLMHENMNMLHCIYLWSKYYIWLTQSEIANFVGWIKGLREKNETFYLEKFNSMHKEVISKFNDNSGFLFESPDPMCLHLENQENEDIFVEVSTQDNDTPFTGSADCNISSNSANLLVVSDKFEMNEYGEFNLTFEEWQNITLTDSEGNIKCNRNWTNVFAEKLAEFVPYCVLVFKIHWFSKLNSRKQNCAYFHARAYCKFNNCLSFHISIQDRPDPLINSVSVHYSTRGIISSRHFEGEFAHSRHLSGNLRCQAAQKLSTSSTSKYYYSQFGDPNKLPQFKNGNLTNLKSQTCLRKVKSEEKSATRFSTDQLVDISETLTYFRQLLPGNLLSGYIQYFAQYPFVIHMHTEEQIKLFNCYKKDMVVLNLDATGSIISNPIPGHNRIFYYALTLQHPNYKMSPVPVAEMISNDHTTAEITHFLHKWFLTCKKVLSKDLNISQVEMDYSWAILHSACTVFNKSSLVDYLEKCWHFIVNKGELYLEPVLHICSAHVMHKFSYQISKKFKVDKKVKSLILYVLGSMISCIEISKLDTLFTSLCYVLASEFITPSVSDHLIALESLIQGEYSFDSEVEYIDKENECNENAKTYQDKSKFGRHFSSMWSECINHIQNYENSIKSPLIKNIYFHPGILKHLLTYYMPLAPMWSGLILNNVKLDNHPTDSNSSVENWFRIVKYSIFDGKLNIKSADFIRQIYPNIQERVAAFRFGFDAIAKNVFESKKRKISQVIPGEEHCKEKWSKRKKRNFSYIYPHKNNIQKAFGQFPKKSNCSMVTTRFLKGQQEDTLQLGNNQLIQNKNNTTASLNSVQNILHKGDQSYNSSFKIPSQDVNIISDCDLVEISIDYRILPPYHPVTPSWQNKIFKDLNLNMVKGVELEYVSEIEKRNMNLQECSPCKYKSIAGDGNCLFSSFCYWITGSIDDHSTFRNILVDNMIGKYRDVCYNYIKNKYPVTVSGFRSTIYYMNKIGMRRDKRWGTDTELFCAALIFQTDIWVYSVANKWEIFSGTGKSMGEVLHSPPSNNLGSIYIHYTGNHYEPILGVVKNI